MFKTKRGAAAAGGAAAALACVCLTKFEGVDYVAKHQSIDPPSVVTVCYGMTNYDRPLKVGQKFTEEECKNFLLNDIPKYDAQVRKCIPTVDAMPPHRHAALISFTYNLGGGVLCKGPARYFNAGNTDKGCKSLLSYTHAAGKYLRGLALRRAFEYQWCLRED